jgi:hypothetical protein
LGLQLKYGGGNYTSKAKYWRLKKKKINAVETNSKQVP